VDDDHHHHHHGPGEADLPPGQPSGEVRGPVPGAISQANPEGSRLLPIFVAESPGQRLGYEASERSEPSSDDGSSQNSPGLGEDDPDFVPQPIPVLPEAEIVPILQRDDDMKIPILQLTDDPRPVLQHADTSRQSASNVFVAARTPFMAKPPLGTPGLMAQIGSYLAAPLQQSPVIPGSPDEASEDVQQAIAASLQDHANMKAKGKHTV
jgi:hypothetical protein